MVKTLQNKKKKLGIRKTEKVVLFNAKSNTRLLFVQMICFVPWFLTQSRGVGMVNQIIAFQSLTITTSACFLSQWFKTLYRDVFLDWQFQCSHGQSVPKPMRSALTFQNNVY